MGEPAEASGVEFWSSGLGRRKDGLASQVCGFSKTHACLKTVGLSRVTGTPRLHSKLEVNNSSSCHRHSSMALKSSVGPPPQKPQNQRDPPQVLRLTCLNQSEPGCV